MHTIKYMFCHIKALGLFQTIIFKFYLFNIIYILQVLLNIQEHFSCKNLTNLKSF